MQKYLCFACSGMRQLDMLAYGVQIEAMSLFDRLFAIQKSRENLMQMVGYIREANIVPEASERELAIAREWIAKM